MTNRYQTLKLLALAALTLTFTPGHLLAQATPSTPPKTPDMSDISKCPVMGNPAPANRHTAAGAMTNRIWKHYLGVGLVEPVDDIRATNPPTNIPLWKALVGEFVGQLRKFSV